MACGHLCGRVQLKGCMFTMSTPYFQGDFSQNLKLLQRFPSMDVHIILEKAALLRKTRHYLGEAEY